MEDGGRRTNELGNIRASYVEVFLEMGFMSMVTKPIVKDYGMHVSGASRKSMKKQVNR